jgi:hypothetical protein
MATRIGEVQLEIKAEINTTDEVMTVFRLTRGEEIAPDAEFKPLQDLKPGDKVRVTIEKL